MVSVTTQNGEIEGHKDYFSFHFVGKDSEQCVQWWSASKNEVVISSLINVVDERLVLEDSTESCR